MILDAWKKLDSLFWNQERPPPNTPVRNSTPTEPIPPPFLVRVFDRTRVVLEEIPHETLIKAIDLLAMATFCLYFTYNCGVANWHFSVISFSFCWFSVGLIPKKLSAIDLETYKLALKNLFATPGVKALATCITLLLYLVPGIGPTAAIVTAGILGIYVNSELEFTPQKILSLVH